MEIFRDPKACYGCRACELICSFHRHSEFRPGAGAITVRKDNRTGEISWRKGSTCDFCEGERQLLCVKYCTYKALRVLREDR